RKPPSDLSGFGSPRPDSLITNSQSQPRRPQAPPPEIFSPSKPITNPLPNPITNTILGMTPPPPPRPQAPKPISLPSPPSPPPPTILQAVDLATPRPIRPLPPINSNSVEELLVNPVPAVNAGVLPLANEKPSEQQLFPPLSNIP
ncbi:hypothetical protein OTU49_012039, partial [Cherax quadricarinatus]